MKNLVAVLAVMAVASTALAVPTFTVKPQPDPGVPGGGYNAYMVEISGEAWSGLEMAITGELYQVWRISLADPETHWDTDFFLPLEQTQYDADSHLIDNDYLLALPEETQLGGVDLPGPLGTYRWGPGDLLRGDLSVEAANMTPDPMDLAYVVVKDGTWCEMGYTNTDPTGQPQTGTVVIQVPEPATIGLLGLGLLGLLRRRR